MRVSLCGRRGVRISEIAKTDSYYMRLALGLAEQAAARHEVPVGAVIVQRETVIGEGWNRPILDQDPTAHAEIVAIRAAALRERNYRLSDCILYVTLEPCAMCIGAAMNARISRVVFGAWDPKAGACGSVLDLTRVPTPTRRIDVFGGVCGEDSTSLLRQFFAARR